MARGEGARARGPGRTGRRGPETVRTVTERSGVRWGPVGKRSAARITRIARHNGTKR
ncbi:hypothetical protein GCM10009549_46250 [Streptomyces thermoalcalitolerans]|uniref:Uncharacterized protein n=1 Tax=Streptomyces thermoalcalitolerans TaxID=65605 RepID=A0ABN1PAI7_9ACTN